MDQSLAGLLFIIAVVGNFVVIAAGVVVTVATALYRGRVAEGERRAAARRHDAAFHHPDPVRTSLFEWVFMLGATGVLLVGLPVVLAATFHYLLPMLGRAWGP